MEMLGHYGHHGLVAFGSLIMLGLFLLLITGAILAWRHRRPDQLHHPGIGVLEERYAKGEIDRDEFVTRRKDLLEA